MAKHYDVVVLGAGVGALAAAALLARRSWRVLVVGQHFRPATYGFDGHALARRPFTFLSATSPAWSRILVELAQSQTFKRRLTPLDPMFQVLASRLRLEVAPDTNLFNTEIDREYPEVRRVVDELYADLARTNAAADAAFERDAVWPPGSFWERRETGRLASTLPWISEESHREFLAEFPRDHDFRFIVEAPATFASHMVGPPPFAVARLHGAWTRGVQSLARGEEELVEFFAERVRAHGGDTKLNERVTQIHMKRGRVTGVLLDGEEVSTGVQFLVTDTTTRALLDLAGFEPSRRTLSNMPRLIPREHRFVVSMVVRDEGIPSPLGAYAFLVPSWPHRNFDPRKPVIFLQRVRGRDRGDVTYSTKPGTTLLVAEAIFSEDYPIPLSQARERVLAAVESLLPFVEKHYVVVDSPHDGRPLWDYRSGARRDVARATFRSTGGSLDAETMTPRWEVSPSWFHKLAGEPIRTPIDGAFVVGPSTLPALGQEGELIAAWGASRMITKTDRSKEKMRKDMWSKIEFG